MFGSTSSGRKLGWKISHRDHRDLRYRYEVPLALPDYVNLKDKFPHKPYDQKQLGSCTANAWAGVLAFEMFNSNNSQEIMPSRLFIYYNERNIENTVSMDFGAMLRTGAKVVAGLGFPDEKYWPYDDRDPGVFQKEPGGDVYSHALIHKGGIYRSLMTNTDIMSCLASGHPLVAGISVYQSFEEGYEKGYIDVPNQMERLLGGHAVVICGYDKNASQFLVRNSWGVTGALGGYFWTSFAYISMFGDDFWTIRY